MQKISADTSGLSDSIRRPVEGPKGCYFAGAVRNVLPPAVKKSSDRRDCDETEHIPGEPGESRPEYSQGGATRAEI